MTEGSHHSGVHRRGLLFLASMIVTVVVLRAYLSLSPDTDLDVFGYNIHHLFTGLMVATIGGIPLALFRADNRAMDLAVVAFGVGLAMALDEWVYLIVTDGTNASYLLPVSLWGAVAVVGLACIYALGWMLVAVRIRCSRAKKREMEMAERI